MPFNLQREHLQFLALLMSVPLQYILMESMGSSEGYRIQAIAQMVRFSYFGTVKEGT